MSKLLPHVSLLPVPGNVWNSRAGSDISLACAHEEILRCGRRLQKGPGRSVEEQKLIRWTEILQKRALGLQQLPDVAVVQVPAEQVLLWLDLLAVLALHSQWATSGENVPFLPCLFSPDRTGHHVDILKQLGPTIEARLKTVLDLRLQAFSWAVKKRDGIVESLSSGLTPFRR